MKPAMKLKITNCNPWIGEVNDNFNPIDRRGNLYMPGVRICGFKDCVNKNHIIPAVKNLETERLDISYRTGKKFHLAKVIEELNA
jgi:hypothetical protein